jgi:CRP-like cAMP-binding protein
MESFMTISNGPMLAPMVNKLARRSSLASADVAALLSLPYRLAQIDCGSYLVREGDKADNCIVLLSGFAYRSKVAGSGARQILSIHLRGDLVDLQNSLLGEADHSVQALTAAAVAYIPQHTILDVAASYPAVAQALWRDTLVDASVFREWILNVGRRDALQRVAHLLCELALRQEEAGLCSGPDYEWPMTQEQIGDATGLTSVHVNRTVGRMRTEGLIRTNGRSITITDWPRLQRAGDFCRAYLHQVPSVTA